MHSAAYDLVVVAHLRWLELTGAMPDTVICRRRALIRMARAMDVPLVEASAAELTAWREGLRVGPATVVAYVSHARGFYTWACDEAGLREDNPADRIPVPRLGRRLPRPIGEDDLRTAVAGAPRRIRPWLVLAGWCGLRAKEIALLRRENVFEAARPPLLIVAWDSTKGRCERAIPLSTYALRELLDAGLPASGWVFRRCDGLPGPNRPWQVSHLANEYLHSCGIRETLHQLRHRFGTQVQQVFHDLRLTQELLGHQSPASTAGYSAVDVADAAAAVEALPAPGRLRVVGG